MIIVVVVVVNDDILWWWYTNGGGGGKQTRLGSSWDIHKFRTMLQATGVFIPSYFTAVRTTYLGFSLWITTHAANQPAYLSVILLQAPRP